MVEADRNRQAQQAIRALLRLGSGLEPLGRGFKVATAPLPEEVRERLEAEGIEGTIAIDFTYPPWHTTGDTLDKVSPVSLEKTGRLVLALLERIAGGMLEVRLPDGTLTAEAELVLVRPPEDFRQQWQAEQPYWKVYP